VSKKGRQRLNRLLALTLGFLALILPASAQTAHPGGFPDPIGPVAAVTTDLYNFLFWITTVIFLFVIGIIGLIIWRFRKTANPRPAKFSHNTVLEIVWTAIPAVICVVIVWKSYEVMTFVRTMPEKGLTVEVIGYQFGWDFYYPDMGEGSKNLAAPEPGAPHPTLSLPEVERYAKTLVIPVDVPIKLHVTASDVIHAFYSADAGVKIDAIPGRINYAWFSADKPGEYIGQCAELCGSAHGEMFFTIKAVPMEAFIRFVNAQRREAGLPELQPKRVMERLS
jgi:cytochrome c oxidase subunit 2